MIKNEIILASAGSGKTYRLTNRFIALMMLGVPAERVIALTFTRKAAGEFFDAILEKLARSADDTEYAREIAEGIGNAEFTPQAAATLLRAFIDAMPRLNLGTLDSFLADVVRGFPYEFGLGGDFEILDPYGIAVEKENVYQQVLASNDANDFLESFKLATYGREDAGVMRNLDLFVKELHETYLAAPSPMQWGNADAIWPGGTSWQLLSAGDLEGVTEKLLKRWQADAELDARIAPRWRQFFDWLKDHRAGAPVAKSERTIFGNLLKAVDDIRNGAAKINIDRKGHELNTGDCAALEKILGHILRGSLEVQLRRTRGLWKVLDSYEKTYNRQVRRRGKLTFADLALLLAGPGTPGGQFVSDGSRREQIDYRLDVRYEHWLLDEFQDTSALQWKSIENLVDEAVQDPEARRSSFLVGDLKQAIYGWRGGDATLFADIRDKYRAMGAERFHEEPLDRSFRSAPAVIEMVNAVFPESGTIDQMFPAMAGRWEFKEHTTAHSSRAGYSAWIAAEAPDLPKPSVADKLQARLEVVAKLITDIQPLERGLSVAVLVSRNKVGSEATDYLRAQTGLPITNEADVGIGGDNPLTIALCSLFRAAAHPGDGFALGHLRMTPFGAAIESAAELSDTVRRSVWQLGFAKTTKQWIESLPQDLDAFSAGRAEEFIRAAAEFDATGSRSIDSFLRFIGNYTVRDAASSGSVQVMTIHKSKGLGFDVVILPDLEGKSMDIPRREIGANSNPEREIEWVLQLPSKDLAKADPVLSEFLEERAAEACYEDLCRHYVALTRAKYANYLVTDALPKKRSTSKSFKMLLTETLRSDDEQLDGVMYETGTETWHQQVGPAGNDDSAGKETLTVPSADLRRHRPKLTAAATTGETLLAGSLFSAEDSSA